jgi:ABC-type multidrug transport system fused ATPase/permease subunit
MAATPSSPSRAVKASWADRLVEEVTQSVAFFRRVLAQVIGETGWQLSQGEKSRLYLARALLQNADVVILDESFGALDAADAHAVQVGLCEFACVGEY